MAKESENVDKSMVEAAGVSPKYTSALIEALDDVRRDKVALQKVSVIVSYLIGERQTVAPYSVRLDFTEVIDAQASWGPIDDRIVDVLVAQPSETMDTFPLFDWLWDRTSETEEEEFFDAAFARLQSAGLYDTKDDFAKAIVGERGDILMLSDRVTSFGRAALTQDFDVLWKVASQSEDHAGQYLTCLYELWELERPKETQERRDELLELIANEEPNGLYWAVNATEQNRPEKALEFAKRMGIDKYKSTLYRVHFYAKKRGSNAFEKELIESYEEHGVNGNDFKRMFEVLDEPVALRLCKHLSSDNFSTLLRLVTTLEKDHGVKALPALVTAFNHDWNRFDGGGSLKSHKQFLNKVFPLLKKYELAEELPRIWQAYCDHDSNDRQTFAKHLASIPKQTREFVNQRLEDSDEASCNLAVLVSASFKKPKRTKS